MALDRISSATSYAALELVRAAAKPTSPSGTGEVSSPRTTAGIEGVLKLIAPADGQAAILDAYAARTTIERSREDALGQLLDARA